MSLAGLGVVAIWHDLKSDAKDNFYEWHNREHMPERAGIAGFRRGRRYKAVAGGPEYFNLYEADSAETMSGPEYMARLNHPTQWTRESVKAFLRVSRSVCRVLYSAGIGQGGAMATLRFDVPHPHQASVAQALRQRMLPVLVDRMGIAGVHLCRADEAASQLETAEKQARSDATEVPAWIVMIEGINPSEVSAAAADLVADLALLGVNSVLSSAYVLELSRAKMPWST